MRILVVEDIDFIRKRLVEELSALPDVEIVWDGPNEPAMIDATRQTKPEFVIMNILVREAARNHVVFDAVETMKQLEPRPVIIVLGDRQDPVYDDVYERELMKRGVDLYMDRSHEIETLPQLLKLLSISRNVNAQNSA